MPYGRRSMVFVFVFSVSVRAPEILDVILDDDPLVLGQIYC